MRVVHGSLSLLGLMLVPKCPGCLAAYVALSTGAVVSLAFAEAMRIGLLVTCGASLLWLGQRSLRHGHAQRVAARWVPVLTGRFRRSCCTAWQTRSSRASVEH